MKRKTRSTRSVKPSTAKAASSSAAPKGRAANPKPADSSPAAEDILQEEADKAVEAKIAQVRRDAPLAEVLGGLMNRYSWHPTVKATVEALHSKYHPVVPRIAYSPAQRQAAEALLRDPDLLDQYCDIVQERVVGYAALIDKLTLMLAGRLVVRPLNKTSYNLCVEGDSGHGKSHVFACIAETLPANQRVLCDRVSPTAPLYMHAGDPDWTWDGKVFLLDDVPNDVLNTPVVKQFLSGFNGESYMTHEGKAVPIRIKGKPPVLTNLVQAVLETELRRRLPRLRVHMSPSHRRRLNASYGARAAGKIQETDNLKVLQCANSLLQRVQVVVPYGDSIPPLFGPTDVDSFSLSAFLDYIKASAALHQHRRERDDRDCVLATEQDYGIAVSVLKNIRFGKDHVDDLKGSEQKVYVLLSRRTEPATVQELMKLYGCSRENLLPPLNSLEEKGLIERPTALRTGGRAADLWQVTKSDAWQAPEFPGFAELEVRAAEMVAARRRAALTHQTAQRAGTSGTSSRKA